MYDPLVVDTFIAAYPEIAGLAQTAGQQARSLLNPSERLFTPAEDHWRRLSVRGRQSGA